jgi:phospholipid N-methyltransferase
MSTSALKERSRGDGPRRRPGLWYNMKPRVKEQLRFLGGFLRDPKQVGAIGPSSPALAAEMIRGFDLAGCDTVVELGPGTGAFTGPILKSIGQKTTFFALELDAQFVKVLQTRFPGLAVYNESAERLPEHLSLLGKRAVDYIVSGLPWASLPMAVQDSVMAAILSSMRAGAQFTTFQYVHARWFPNALRFQKRLRRNFARVEVSEVVWRNFPPAVVYRCTR